MIFNGEIAWPALSWSRAGAGAGAVAGAGWQAGGDRSTAADPAYVCYSSSTRAGQLANNLALWLIKRAFIAAAQ